MAAATRDPTMEEFVRTMNRMYFASGQYVGDRIAVETLWTERPLLVVFMYMGRGPRGGTNPVDASASKVPPANDCIQYVIAAADFSRSAADGGILADRVPMIEESMKKYKTDVVYVYLLPETNQVRFGFKAHSQSASNPFSLK